MQTLVQTWPGTRQETWSETWAGTRTGALPGTRTGTWAEKAYAKINLTLEVLHRQPDGYHDLRSLMQTVSLYDVITVTHSGDGTLRAASNLASLPTDRDNLVVAAAEVFLEATGIPVKGLCFTIEKNIPVFAGLGGGSADAAAALRLLNRAYAAGLSARALEEMAHRVGSDVPFCVRGGTQLAEGRGERLSASPPLPPCYILLCKPPAAVSTREAFAWWDASRDETLGASRGVSQGVSRGVSRSTSLGASRGVSQGAAKKPDLAGFLDALSRGYLSGAARCLGNVLEAVLPPTQADADVAQIKGMMMDAGALGAVMSGSGPTVAGLFDDAGACAAAGATLRERYADVYVTRPVSPICG
ncbi:MAG: 4-(cytidine 5'-diphospho)-2-C-methyl-D-erythritol kinase [Oscillospiraceae bacterium]|nr:4-(cytidine 5'-diphospho)-2-C-methyl-D-erythritol kinase [Oscillospiraceae bacterium]